MPTYERTQTFPCGCKLVKRDGVAGLDLEVCNRHKKEYALAYGMPYEIEADIEH